ncbi:MAG: MFS transporter [Pseudomonadota bacterium]
MTEADPLHERSNVLILAISQALFLIAAVTVMTLSGVVGGQLAPSPGLATLPVAAMMVGTVVSTLPASLFMKRVGRRIGFLVGTLVGGAAGAALAATGVVMESFWLFTLGNLLLGIYQAFAMYYRFAAADVASDAYRSRAISLVMAGGVVAAFLGPWNAHRGQGMLLPGVPEAGPYVILLGLALLAAFLVSFLRVPPVNEPHGEPQRPLAAIVRQPTFLVALVAAAIGYAVMILVMTATPLAMREAGFAMEQAAFVMQWHVLGMFAPSFVTGNLIARFGVGRILLTGGILLVASALTAVSGGSLLHFWIALVLLGVGWNFLFIGGSNLLTTTHAVAERGKVQGVNDLTVFTLVAAGSLLSGLLLHHLSWVGLNLFVLPFVAATLLATLWWLASARRRASVSG